MHKRAGGESELWSSPWGNFPSLQQIPKMFSLGLRVLFRIVAFSSHLGYAYDRLAYDAYDWMA